MSMYKIKVNVKEKVVKREIEEVTITLKEEDARLLVTDLERLKTQEILTRTAFGDELCKKLKAIGFKTYD